MFEVTRCDIADIHNPDNVLPALIYTQQNAHTLTRDTFIVQHKLNKARYEYCVPQSGASADHRTHSVKKTN